MEKTQKVTVKTETQFRNDNLWNKHTNSAHGWNVDGDMNHLLGETIEVTADGSNYAFYDEKNDYEWMFTSADFTKGLK